VTAPPLLLAVAGLMHPSTLNVATAQHWVILHIALLPVFPLVTVGFILPLRDIPRHPLTVLTWAAAFGYACFYTGLDAVAGIAAGTLVERSPQPVDRDLLVNPLYEFFEVGSTDHHGFAVTCCMLTILCLAAGGAGRAPVSLDLVVVHRPGRRRERIRAAHGDELPEHQRADGAQPGSDHVRGAGVGLPHTRTRRLGVHD
jgi:hypothetical protein